MYYFLVLKLRFVCFDTLIIGYYFVFVNTFNTKSRYVTFDTCLTFIIRFAIIVLKSKGGYIMEKFKFEKLSAKDIHDYMMKHATNEQKKEFKEVAFVNNKKKVAETIIGEDGNPVMYQVLDKNKKPKSNHRWFDLGLESIFRSFSSKF